MVMPPSPVRRPWRRRTGPRPRRAGCGRSARAGGGEGEADAGCGLDDAVAEFQQSEAHILLGNIVSKGINHFYIVKSLLTNTKLE